MTIWTLLKCDYFDGLKFCTNKFRTNYSWTKAQHEAKTYGWSESTALGIRCPEHRTTPNEPFPWKEA